MNPPEEIPLGDLTLRRWRAADAEALNRAIDESLEHLRPWMPWAGTVSVDQRRATLARWERDWEQGGDLVWGLFDRGAVLGSFGLHRRLGPNGLEVGYWVHAGHTRRGLATAGAAAMTSVAFDVPGIELVEIHHDRANIASEGIPRKLGFVLVGDYPRHQPPAAATTEVMRAWRMTREAWLTRR
ncbi:MAG TPA: GNAT family N-acetyltransferase [Candidatus Binatia bacterium]|nr:GNAT family N-acetyltransferase [Candidatus Binatia bacterium]